jgi:hypothetical protein
MISDVVVDGGADPSMFAVESDGCSGTTLSLEDVCSFVVRFSPSGTTGRASYITVGAQGAYPHTFPVSGVARSPILAVPSGLRLNSDPGMWIGDGAIVDDSQATMTESGDDHGDDAVRLLIPGGKMSFATGDGERLEVGHYDVPSYPPFVGPFMAVSAFGHGCQPTGEFDVVEAPVRDVDGALLSVAIDFVQYCDGGPERLRGSIRFHSMAPLWDVLPPIGTVGPASGPNTVSDPVINLDVTATDDAGVTTVALSNDGSEWLTIPYRETVEWSLVDPDHGGRPDDGAKEVSARWTDGHGNESRTAVANLLLDRVAPVGAIAIEDGAAYTGDLDVMIAVASADPSGLSQVSLSNDGLVWVTRTYAPQLTWTLNPTSGSMTVFARLRDGAGNWSEPVSDVIDLDTTPPSVSAPSHRLISGTAVNAGRVTVRLTWTGSDAASGIAGYSLEQQTDGGPWAVVAPALAGPTVDRLLAPQHSYRFRVSAVDQAGNPTGPVSGATFTLSRYSENNAKVAYSGRWKTSTSSVFWGGAARKSSSAGAKASLTFSGRSASWVARKGPDRGKAAVYVNGTKLATIDLYSPTYQSQRVVWAGTWSTSASRKLTIRVSGTSGRPRVDVDAFVTAN